MIVTFVFTIIPLPDQQVLLYSWKLASLLVLFDLIIKIGIKKPFQEAFAELEAKNNLLYDLSRIDELTNVPNRRSLFESLDKTLRFSKREKQTMVVLMIDIDDFKGYNDTFGHLHGDSILIRVANAINKECKRPLDFSGRYGGEEFLVVLPNSDFEAGRVLCERIIKSIRELRIVRFDKEDQFLSVSIGYASISPTVETTTDYPLLEADNQLYKVKESGKNNYLGINLDQGE